MRDLPPAEHAVVLAILATGDAAPLLEPIVAIYGEAAVAGLIAAGLLVRWQFEGSERVTFTPLAVCVHELDLAERVVYVDDERTINGAQEHRSIADEKPYFVGAGSAWGVPLGEDRYGVVQPPEPGRWVRLERPELVEDKRPSAAPEYLLDEVSEQPIELFRGPEGMAPGVKVKIDPKLAKGKPRRRGPKRAG